MMVEEFWLGGNVFGWTADRQTAFDVLDAAYARGIRAIDTADVYSAWANGGCGGQSERIVGEWLSRRGARRSVTIATKVGMLKGAGDIRPSTIRGAIRESLRRLQSEYVDLYYLHRDDGGDLHETLVAMDRVVTEGKARAIALSNFTAERAGVVMQICAEHSLTQPSVLQTEYSLMEREFERELRSAATEAQLAVLAYRPLAGGFLTGKYRSAEAGDKPARLQEVRRYMNEPRAGRVIRALEVVAANHQAPLASVALAWVRSRPGITGFVASASRAEQVEALWIALRLTLAESEIAMLESVSRGVELCGDPEDDSTSRSARVAATSAKRPAERVRRSAARRRLRP